MLYFREGTLALRLHPEESGVALLDRAEPLPHARPLPAVLTGVSAAPDDRLLLLRFRRVRGRRRDVLLAVELLPNQENAVVAEVAPDGDGPPRIRHVLLRREGERPLHPGAPYARPPLSPREGADGSLTLGRWTELLRPLPPKERRGALLGGVAWSSSINAAALLGEAVRSEGAEAERALEAGHALWLRLVAAAGGAPEPALLEIKGALQPYPLALPGVGSQPEAGLLDAFARAAEARGDAGAALVPGAWLDALEVHATRLGRRADRLRQELEEAPDPDAVRALGDLLLARYAEIPKGAEKVELEDFGGHVVEVRLDPALPVHENAARYYERAARAERARERLPALVRRARDEADRVAALLARARAGEADPQEVRATLPADRPTGSAQGEPGPSLPYRTYRSSGGLEIRVGKGSRANDDLTFHHSAPDDVWLHARHAAGAHVVLRWRGEGNPPARDLAEAAALAALHSRARGSASVPVDWTRRKHVRKPRKAPPGAVTVERAQTLFVEPDPGLEERLATG